MLAAAARPTRTFRQRLAAAGIEQVLLTDESSIACFAGFWRYLGVAFGRPTCLLLHPHHEPVVITPRLKAAVVAGMTFDVDGGVTLPGRCGGRIGDSIVVTDDRFEFLTEYPRTGLTV